MNGSYQIQIGQQLGISTNVFTGYASNVDGHTGVSIGDSNLEYFHSTAPGQNSITTTFDTSNFVTGSSYDLDISFDAVVDKSNALAGAYSVAVYTKSLFINVQAIPEPSTYAQILGAFAIVGAVVARHRRIRQG